MDFESYPQNGGSSADQPRPDGLNRPRADRFAPDADGYDEAMRRHDAAVESNSDGYLDPISGLFVMTALYLIRRGYCCDRGCRHCPFEPRHTDDG